MPAAAKRKKAKPPSMMVRMYTADARRLKILAAIEGKEHPTLLHEIMTRAWERLGGHLPDPAEGMDICDCGERERERENDGVGSR